MKKVISVRFKDNGKTYYFDPADTPIKTGDYVIVETARGVECGEVVQGVKEIADSAVPKALKPITRIFPLDFSDFISVPAFLYFLFL